MDRGGAAATLQSADLASSGANGLESSFRQQAAQKTTTLSTIVVNSGSTRVVIALVQTKDWLELKVLELTPALTLLGIDLEEALQLQQAHNEVLLRIQSKQSPVEEMLRKADELIASQKGGRAEVYAAMADSLAVAWQDVNTQLHRRKTILDFNVRYHRNATLCLERTRALEMSVCGGAPLPVEVSAIEELLARLHQARRAMLESLMLALQDGRCLLDELQAIAQEGTLDSRPDHIRTAANCGQ